MQEHPEIGARILEPVPYFADLVPLVRSSHERYDGTGYPEGLTGETIPMGSRVIAVCDAFHAMTEDRVYRRRSTSTRQRGRSSAARAPSSTPSARGRCWTSSATPAPPTRRGTSSCASHTCPTRSLTPNRRDDWASAPAP